nr:MAG TPA: hypothetical protein [Caudoviricetes sp.]
MKNNQLTQSQLTYVAKNTAIHKVSDDFTMATFTFPDGFAVSAQEYNCLHQRGTLKPLLRGIIAERVAELVAAGKHTL